MSITIRVPAVLPSLNSQKRMHWAEYARLRKAWAWHIIADVGQPIIRFPYPFARITFTRHASRLLDADNLAGAFKPVLDVLRPMTKTNPNGLGFIEDDDASHVVVTYQQAKCPAKLAHTTIHIEAWAA